MRGSSRGWPFRREGIFGTPMGGKIQNEQEIDNV